MSRSSPRGRASAVILVSVLLVLGGLARLAAYSEPSLVRALVTPGSGLSFELMNVGPVPFSVDRIEVNGGTDCVLYPFSLRDAPPSLAVGVLILASTGAREALFSSVMVDPSKRLPPVELSPGSSVFGLPACPMGGRPTPAVFHLRVVTGDGDVIDFDFSANPLRLLDD